MPQRKYFRKKVSQIIIVDSLMKIIKTSHTNLCKKQCNLTNHTVFSCIIVERQVYFLQKSNNYIHTKCATNRVTDT